MPVMLSSLEAPPVKDAPDAELEADGQSSVHSAGPLRSALMLELLLGRARGARRSQPANRRLLCRDRQ